MLSQFSPNGQYFALASPDGTLKIWDTITSSLKHEYTPSSHLSATCTCLSWAPNQANKTPTKKKSDSVRNLTLLALGTTSGDILLYSLTKGNLHTQLGSGHSGRVNSLCWSGDGGTLFSCSDDQHIIEWDVAKSKVKEKWRGDKTGVHAIALCQTESHLLSASRGIKLWCLETHQVIQTFIGHATEVLVILPVLLPRPAAQNGDVAGGGAGARGGLEGSYFLTAAAGDRVVNAWQVSGDKKSKTALATFSLGDEPAHACLKNPTQAEPTIILAVTTKQGQLAVFEHQLNGRCKAPLQPSARLQVACTAPTPTLSTPTGTPRPTAPTTRPLPVLCAHVSAAATTQLSLAHGNCLRPSFETMPYRSLEPETCLIRDPTALKTTVELETEVSKVKRPLTEGEVTVLTPAVMAPAGPQQPEAGNKEKRKRHASVDMTMEERLNALSMVKPGERAEKKAQPKTDSLATLLTQGLHSQDTKLLDSVLHHGDVRTIRHTIGALPLPVIAPLVQELTKRITKHSQTARTCLKWLRTVLTVHTAYLMSFPSLVDSLGALYQLMESRCQMFSRLMRLQGRLDLILTQIASQEARHTDADSTKPILLYQDDSSDEEFGMEDVLPLHSESEDNWEGVSEEDDDDEGEMDVSEGREASCSPGTRPVKRARNHTDSEGDQEGEEAEEQAEEGEEMEGGDEGDEGGAARRLHNGHDEADSD